MKRALTIALALTALAIPGRGTTASGPFTIVDGFATKIGFRGVVVWQASGPVAGYVRYGAAPGNLAKEALPLANMVDSAQVALLENLEVGSTVYYEVVDRLTGLASGVKSFKAANAYNAWSGGPQAYTINALAAIDSPGGPDNLAAWLSVTDFAAAINILSERLYDAMDGYARIGTVLVTDTALNYPVNVPARGTLCRDDADVSTGGTPADFLVETTVPFDSHTWAGWMIASGCTGFYVGRLGWLAANPWQNDLDLGYTLSHEFMHYAFNAPDLYSDLTGAGGCNNSAWDGSLMHNTGGYRGGRWFLTELDRNQSLTPCNHSDATNWTWATLRERYTNVPAPTAPKHVTDTLARGNPDGGALKIWTLRQSPPNSTLTLYEPGDGSSADY
ncbi:MAG TPA: hypothetical protein VGB83_09490 [Actinomycetota bacterium]